MIQNIEQLAAEVQGLRSLVSLGQGEGGGGSYRTPVVCTPVIQGGGGLDLSKFVGGMSYSGLEVTLKAGRMQHGVRGYISAGSTTKTLPAAAGDYYLWLEYEVGGAVAWAGPSADEPVNDDTHFRMWCYKFTVADGAISDYLVGCVGIVSIPGMFA